MKIKTKYFLLLILFSVLIKGQDCVLVHGWTNDGSIWNGTGVKSILQNEYDFDRILQPSLGGTYSASQQSLNLRNYLNNYNVNNSLVISHSMGGMNTRYHLKRQFQQSQPSRINYHFTIGSTHLGALIANNREYAVNRLLTVFEAALKPGGYLGGNIIEGIGVYYVYENQANYVAVMLLADFFEEIIHNEGGPALDDLEMGSSADLYINQPNTIYESNIAKVGIAGVEDYPEVYRIAASGFGISENEMLDVVDWVVYYKLAILIADFINYAENPLPQNLVYLEESLGTLSLVLEFPKTWNLLVTGSTSGQSDGLVQKTSQIYPNYNFQYYANGANHIEEKSHSQVLRYIREAMDYYDLGAPPELSVSISGPTSLQSYQNGTWTATVSGGNPPYHYQWSYYYPCNGLPLVQDIEPLAPPCGYWWDTGSDSPQLTRSDFQDFRLKCVVTDASTSATSNIIYVNVNGSLNKDNLNEEGVPLVYSLEQNYPNPFNPATSIKYQVSRSEIVVLKVFDVLGNEVTTLVNEQKAPGRYEVQFNAENLASGVYVYRLNVGSYSLSKKMIVLK